VTKQEFVDAVADKAGLSKRDAGAAVDAALDVIQGTLQNGDSVAFTGFGKFHVTRRAARASVSRIRRAVERRVGNEGTQV
jgi:DNA-binding protein HU-beta